MMPQRQLDPTEMAMMFNPMYSKLSYLHLNIIIINYSKGFPAQGYGTPAGQTSASGEEAKSGDPAPQSNLILNQEYC
jgi:hypothetical protein